MEQLTFVDLNPTVISPDERRLCAQVVKLHNLLKYYKRTGQRLTNIILCEEIGYRFGARIHELRKWLIIHRDQCIDTHRADGGVTWYELKEISQSEYYKARRLELAEIRSNRL